MTDIDDRIDQELRDHFRRTDTEAPDELRRLGRLYAADGGAPPPGRRRGSRMRRSLIAAAVVVAVAVATAVPLTVALTQHHPAPASGPSPNPTLPVTPQPSPLGSLNAYVTAASAREAEAAASDPSQAVWPANIAERSQPVPYGGEYLAVAAFGFDPGGRPVQVLAYSVGSWAVVAALPPPADAPGSVHHPDALDLFGSTGDAADISVGYATGAAPDFLIPFAGGGCGQGPVVSDAGGTWHYMTFVGDGPTTDYLGGNPRFDGSTVVSDDNCSAILPPPSQRHTWIFTYDASSGDLLATEQPGWPSNP